MAVFLTGATGFLGTEVAAELIKSTEDTIYVLVRGRDEDEIVHRLKSAWYEIKELYREIGKRIVPLAGDFTEPDLGLDPSVIRKLRGTITRIYHVGAETGIQKSRDELMRVNRNGTGNVLRFARRVDANGSLRRFVFVSTAYTAGLRTGKILETDPLPEHYATYYEMSKGKAEELVKKSGLPYTICRPGMIVGHSENGRIRNFNTIYYVLKLMMQGQMHLLPVSPSQKINIVPVDYVANAVVQLSQANEATNASFHLTPSDSLKPTAGELAEYVGMWAEERMGVHLRKPAFVPMPILKRAGLAHNRKTEEKKKTYFGNLAALMPYFYDEHEFDRTNADRLLGPYQPDWREYLGRLLRFACRHNFLHQTERNVFEQVLFRLQSKSAPISYFDVSADGLRETTGAEMIERINRVRAGLEALGVRKGDKVALTGSNCTDYFSLDIAIGLCGGVTVPIYYTTPVEEIDLLLDRSGAKWFFVGDRRIMKQIDELKSPVPVIAFFSALEIPQGTRQYMTWEEFLGRGDGLVSESEVAAEDVAGEKTTDACPERVENNIEVCSAAVDENEESYGGNVDEDGAGKSTEASGDNVDEDVTGKMEEAFGDNADSGAEMVAKNVEADAAAGKTYVDPEDLATIRYTSGTTGEPKGVMFNVSQLAWMGQIMTDLLPWEEKQKELRYLSFLPLSHVVEGILASYAPYYVHCPAKFYYLNDFDRLTAALPEIRPTVFFSVPRFYEKLWQQIEENPVGRRYLQMPDSPQKTALGKVLKRVVLKKAGLDKCSQLIVGSAPISEELLLRMRKLGIEIHNAYGQTEAPLITINRMGDNVIPSIGTALPDTTVTVQDDGELIIEGPQVCLGYYGLETDTIKDGVLKSGDLGTMDENGHIYLIGRKKEMIITSYGKNINCPKIEERLKNISGVSEAVLIGENRPYCTALLWMEETADASGLEGAIERMNEHLSHPEQIRKWRLIEEPLSIRKGELTPNLKVKRNVVQEHFRDEIAEMYES